MGFARLDSKLILDIIFFINFNFILPLTVSTYGSCWLANFRFSVVFQFFYSLIEIWRPFIVFVFIPGKVNILINFGQIIFNVLLAYYSSLV